MAKSNRPAARVRVVQLAHAKGLPLPAHQTEHSAGLDLVAAVDDDAPVLIPAGGLALVPTGLILELPPGTEGQVRPRSGLAMKHAITVLNSPGTIDADYRGEVKVLLINLGKTAYVVARGERIAQLVVAHYTRVRLVAVSHLPATKRGGWRLRLDRQRSGRTATARTPQEKKERSDPGRTGAAARP